MFTGIVEEVGRVAEVRRREDVRQVAVWAARTARGLKVGESVAVNGVCLTVVGGREGRLDFDIVPETLRRTALGGLRKGDPVNLERALPVLGRLNGHLVQGHVDGVGRVASKLRRGADVRLTVSPPRHLMKYVAVKGSIALEGVSLTVAGRTAGSFTVALVPYTLVHTTLGKVRMGQTVNVEVDVLARYLEVLNSHGV